jgi:hypothetical protein
MTLLNLPDCSFYFWPEILTEFNERIKLCSLPVYKERTSRLDKLAIDINRVEVNLSALFIDDFSTLFLVLGVSSKRKQESEYK